MRDDYVNNKIDHKFIWLTVLTPSIGIFLDFLLGIDIAMIIFPIAWVFLFLDRKELSKKNQEKPHLAWVLIFPVYLWKRAELVGGDKNYLWAFFAIPVLAYFLAGGVSTSAIESAATDLTTQIIRENLGIYDVECTDVTIDEEVYEGNYSATASLSNGTYLTISIETNDAGDVYVEIDN